MSENQKRSAPINQEQKQILTDFLQSHEELLSGKFSNEFTKKTAQQLWEEISCSLNSVPGGAKKTWTQWRKTWQDIKKNVKSKSAAEKRYAGATGGGPVKIMKFDETESKIMSLISPKVTVGDISVPVPSENFNFNQATFENIDTGISFSIGEEETNIILTEAENMTLTEIGNNRIKEDTKENQNLSTPTASTRIPLSSKKRLNKTKRLDTSMNISANLVKIEEQKKDAMCKYYEKKARYFEWKQHYENEKLTYLKQSLELQRSSLDLQRTLVQEIGELKNNLVLNYTIH